MPRDFDLDFDDDDLMRPRRQQAPRQSQQMARQPQQRPQQRPQRDFGNTSSLDGIGTRGAAPKKPARRKNQTGSIIILAVEVVVFIALLVTFFVLKAKMSSSDTGSDSATESSAEGSSGGVNVESDNFSLTCSKVQLANDANGNPAALIYFTFVNKTDTPMSMNDVFPPSVTQNGVSCSMSAQLAEEPAEVANQNTQVSGGESIECCYAVELQDFTSTLTLTIHDNYETFSDIGSTEIPLS